MKATSYKVSDTLYLVVQPAGKAVVKKAVEAPVNHIAVIDCSGSMYGELPRIREQLKLKLPKLLGENDTVSIVWFSGRGQFGALLEGERVATLTDLSSVNKAIDRWLTPQGLTGFKEPLEEVAALAARVSKKNPGAASSLFFMSDGCDNQWGRADVLKAVEKAAGAVASATFVEYGYYADRPLLTAMAEKAGGTLIFADAFDKYAPAFEAAMQKKPSAPRVEVKVGGDPVGGFAFAVSGGDLYAYEAGGGKATVPEDLPLVAYLSPSPVGADGMDVADIAKHVGINKIPDPSKHEVLSLAYAAVSLYSVRMKPDVVYPLLRALGDVRFIEQFSGCFGKQKYSEFMDAAKSASLGQGRFEKGWDPNKVPKDDAFTVLDLLRVLAEDDGNRVLLDHPSFKYSRIGRARVDASTALSAKELEEVQRLGEEISKERDVQKLKGLQDRLATLTAPKGEALKFVADPAPDGYPVSALVYNEERPNISIQIRKEGTVDLSGRLPAEYRGDKVGKVPAQFRTFVYRNYAIVKDGLVNVQTLPVRLTRATFETLDKEGLVAQSRGEERAEDGSPIVLVDLSRLPIVNRKMVGSVSAKALFEKEYELARARAAQKVYNSFSKELLPAVQKKSEAFDALYGAEAAAWLKEQGFTDYSGFNPKTVQAESTDVYMAKELQVSLKGLSKLPSLKELREMIAKNKVNAPGQLMMAAYREVEAFAASKELRDASDQNVVVERWFEQRQTDSTRSVRRLLRELAELKFSIVVGQVWPSEFKSIDENTLTIDADGKPLECKLTAREVEQKI